jgi:hypothetical protein
LAPLFVVSQPVRAQTGGDSAWTRLRRKNGEAAEAFQAYSFRKGKLHLEQALELAERLGLAQDARLAQTYVLIGVGELAADNDTYRGVHAFVRALRLDAKVALPPALVTPQCQQAFATAKEAVAAIKTPELIKFTKRRGQDASAPLKIDRSVRGLVHVPLDEVKRGYPIPIKVAAGADVRVQRVLLYYRSAGEVKYVQSPLKREGGLFRGSIPAQATRGRYVHYYVEGLDPRGRLAATNGSARGPNVVTIK